MNGSRIPHLHIEDYHGPAHRQWFTNTALKHAGRWGRDGIEWTPSHLRRYLDGGYATTRSAALMFGEAFHALAEGKAVEDVAVIIPKDVRRGSTAYKEWYAKKLALLGPTRLVKQGELTWKESEVLRNAHESLCQSGLVKELLTEKQVSIEGTIRWVDSVLHLNLQSRPDLETEQSIIDWKTDRDPHDFLRKAYGLGYHRSARLQQQAVFEVTGELKRVIHVVVGKKPPYDVVVHELPQTALDLGWSELRIVLERVKLWMDTNFWTSEWEHEINRDDLPAWCYGRSAKRAMAFDCGDDVEVDSDECDDDESEWEDAA